MSITLLENACEADHTVVTVVGVTEIKALSKVEAYYLRGRFGRGWRIQRRDLMAAGDAAVEHLSVILTDGTPHTVSFDVSALYRSLPPLERRYYQWWLLLDRCRRWLEGDARTVPVITVSRGEALLLSLPIVFVISAYLGFRVGVNTLADLILVAGVLLLSGGLFWAGITELVKYRQEARQGRSNKSFWRQVGGLILALIAVVILIYASTQIEALGFILDILDLVGKFT